MTLCTIYAYMKFKLTLYKYFQIKFIHYGGSGKIQSCDKIRG